MKKFKILIINLCICIILSSFGIHANAQIDSLRLTLDNVFANVDKSQIPGGFLEEYGAQFANLKTYNGTLTDSNYVNAMAWHYIYASVYSAKIFGTNTMPSPETNYTVFNAEAVANPGVNPVSMMALNYSSLKPDAMVNNLFTISNNQLYDVPGRSQSPYKLNTAFAAAPFYETDGDGVLDLLFKQQLFVNTTGKSVSSIQVNFDDGNGFVVASWNTIVSTSYFDTGIKKLTFKLNFTDASSLQCYSKVRILKAAFASRYLPTTVTIPFDPVNDNHSGGDITVQYSINNTSPTGSRKFQKPFIVVEGFDMHDAAPLLMPEGYDYNSFWNEITLGNAVFDGNDFNFNLDNNAGYDLIFLNYRDGTDNILRNALLLEEVIAWVNSEKAAGADQNVVMGISMGGLVSRYCLAKMTKENNHPQTRLLITHDSPHRGANIPLGMQYMLNGFANTKILGLRLQNWVPLLRQAVNLQLRPATMQQLIVRDNPSTGNLEYNTFLVNNGVYRNMVTFLSSDIQPDYTFVATSQGSQCGETVLQPYAELLKTSGDAGYTIGFGGFGHKLSGSMAINALPNGTTSQRIAHFKLKLTSKVFWININNTLVNFSRNSPSGILGFDGAPGGTIPISRGTGIGNIPPSWGYGPAFLPAFIFEYVYNFEGLQVAPEFSFVPTASALDQENITAASLYASNTGYSYISPSDLTLLQKYKTQENLSVSGVNISNIEHTDFTARNAQWIFNEMEDNIQHMTAMIIATPT